MRRRAVLQQLALAANSNGKSICLGADRIAADTGLHRATIFRILQDLRALKFLSDEGAWHPKYHTRVRSLEVTAALEAAKKSAKKQPSQIEQNDRTNDRTPEAEEPSQINFEPSQINFEPSQINFEPSQINPDPTEELTEQLTEERIDTGAQAHDRWIEEVNDFSDSVIPSRYFTLLTDLIEGHLGWRDPRRDYGALRALWQRCWGSPIERYTQCREALEAGRDYAESVGAGADQLFYWAGVALDGGYLPW